MAAWNSIEGVVTGRVEAVNERGLKINGDWVNISKYAVGVELPEKGAAVALTLDKAGFIRGIDSLDALPAPVRGGSDAPAPKHDRERTITRLSVLKAASEFAAARPNLKSGEVLLIAESWERWVLRDDETDNVDAF